MKSFQLDMIVILWAGTKCCKNDIQRKITQRQHKVELQLLGTAFLNIATNKHNKVMLQTKNYSNELSNSWANNSTCSGPITPLIKLIIMRS